MSDALSNNCAKGLDPVVQAALDRLKAIIDAERSYFVAESGPEAGMRIPAHVPEMSTADLFWVFTDPEAKRQFKAHVGIQEVQSFGRP